MVDRRRFSLILPVRILWIEEEQGPLRAAPEFSHDHLSITTVASLLEAVTHLEAGNYQAVLVTMPLHEGSLESVMEQLHSPASRMPVILYAPQAALSDAVHWTKLGAWQVVHEPEELHQALHEIAAGPTDVARSHPFAFPAEWRGMLIGQSARMQNIAEIIRLIAPRRCTVLITGETGTGKEVVARAIHAAGNRARLEFVAVNCSALPDHLLEAELFGHVRGAFTGATTLRIGRFEQARGSTLFLDEIGDLPLPLQAKLLRVLQEREFQRLGSSETIRADVRVIAATNSNLAEKVQKGEFREDLYYRLNVVPIALPPIRERVADIPPLVHHFVAKICREEGIPPKQVSSEVMDRLLRNHWPGNVRQIENAVEMAIALSGERLLLCPSDFPLASQARPRQPASSVCIAVPDHGLDFEQTVGNFELDILQQALRKTGGNKKLAADMLRLKRTTLSAKLRTLSGSAAVLAQ